MKQRQISKFPIITDEFSTLYELADVMEVSTKTAQRTLQGLRPFRIKEKRRICDYLGRELKEVFGDA